jgi:hypothetical protein
VADLSADDSGLLADLEAANTYPHVERHLRAGARTYTVTVWPPGGQAAVTTDEHDTPPGRWPRLRRSQRGRVDGNPAGERRHHDTYLRRQLGGPLLLNLRVRFVRWLDSIAPPDLYATDRGGGILQALADLLRPRSRRD